MENWKTNLQVMAAKERQYMQQCANYKVKVSLLHSFYHEIRKNFWLQDRKAVYLFWTFGSMHSQHINLSASMHIKSEFASYQYR